MNILDEFAKSLNKSLGDDVVDIISDDLVSHVKTFIPTGCTPLDYIISNKRGGGIPVGKITEISGLEASGKSLLAMQICANTQKMGGLPFYIDNEFALNPDFAERVGLDLKNNMVVLRANSIEDTFKAMFEICHTIDKIEKNSKDQKYKFYTIVLDSVAATPVNEDIVTENPDPSSQIGIKARVISKNLNVLLQKSGRKNVALIFINQLREIIGAKPFQDKYSTPGGKAIPFASSVRIRLSSMAKVKVGEDIVGIKTVAKVIKTRFGPPHRTCEFPLYFTNGIDDAEAIMELLKNKGAIKTKNGGQKGTLFVVGNKQYNKTEFKNAFLDDASFKKDIMNALDSVMIRELTDPKRTETEDEEPSIGD